MGIFGTTYKMSPFKLPCLDIVVPKALWIPMALLFWLGTIELVREAIPIFPFAYTLFVFTVKKRLSIDEPCHITLMKSWLPPCMMGQIFASVKAYAPDLDSME